MDKKVAALRSGVLGYFWTEREEIGNRSTMEAGYLSIGEASCRVKTIEDLDGDRPLMRLDEIPSAIFGVSESGGIGLYGISFSSARSRPTGRSVSTREFISQLALTGVHVENLKSARLQSLQFDFLGVVHWFGGKLGSLDRVMNENGTVSAMTYSLPTVNEETCFTIGEFKVSLCQGWSVREHRMDEFYASTPLKISIEPGAPKHWEEYRPIVESIHSLINLAYDSRVCAVEGSAIPEYAEEAPSIVSPMWSSALMEVPEGVRSLPDTGVLPAFRLSDISGMEGLSRWVELCLNCPRAVGPLVSKFRVGKGIAEEQFVSTVLGIVYWVDLCKRHKNEETDWARVKPPRKGGAEVEVLAIAMGQEFDQFVGGRVRKWSRMVWDKYKLLKHDPSKEYDIGELYTLLRGARVLLMGALLSYSARSTSPMRMIRQAHQYYQDSLDTQGLVGRKPCTLGDEA